MDGIGNDLKLHGEGGSDTLNVDDTGGQRQLGTLTPTMIKGLDMAAAGSPRIVRDPDHRPGHGRRHVHDQGYACRHDHVDGNNGNDSITIEAISGPTTVSGGNDADTFDVGANVGTVNRTPTRRSGH